jgi:Lar family restriction alleviation protein
MVNSMKNIDIKNCPFCGYVFKNITDIDDLEILQISWGYHLYCDECGVKGPGGGTTQLSIESWNKRNHGSVMSYKEFVDNLAIEFDATINCPIYDEYTWSCQIKGEWIAGYLRLQQEVEEDIKEFKLRKFYDEYINRINQFDD